MKFRRDGWTWIVTSLAIFGLLMIGVTLPGCGGSDAVSKKPADPATPADPAIPADPTEPSDPPEPSDPVEPTDPAEPSDPAEPTDPVEPTDPASPPAPKVSTFAPAEDLVVQLAGYVEDLEEAVETEEDYDDSTDKIVRLANTLAVMAQGLGLHDEDNAHKASAGTLVKASQDLAATSDFASAKAAIAAVKAAAASQDPSDVDVKWGKVASLEALMKQVPLVNTKLKGCIRRIERKAKDGQAHAAVIALIGQAAMSHADETDPPDQEQKWLEFCIEMRDAAAAVNAGIRATDTDATTAGMARLGQSCDTCHEVFHPDDVQE